MVVFIGWCLAIGVGEISTAKNITTRLPAQNQRLNLFSIKIF